MENYHTRTSRAVTTVKSRLKAYPNFELHIRVSSTRLKLSADLAAFVAVDCTRESCALIESDCKNRRRGLTAWTARILPTATVEPSIISSPVFGNFLESLAKLSPESMAMTLSG